MSITTIHGAFYNYVKTNTIVPSVFYISADKKTKSPYITVMQTDDPNTNTLLCSDNGETRFLVTVFQSSYTKGINNRQALMDYIKLLRGETKNGFTIWNITIENSWDNDKNVDNLYAFNSEVLIRWEK